MSTHELIERLISAAGPDAQEGMSAFLDKRTPVWSDR